MRPRLTNDLKKDLQGIPKSFAVKNLALLKDGIDQLKSQMTAEEIETTFADFDTLLTNIKKNLDQLKQGILTGYKSEGDK